MSTTQKGTVKETGASSGDVLIGIEPDANIGLAVEISASQPQGEGGRIQGGFRVLDPAKAATPTASQVFAANKLPIKRSLPSC